MLAFEMSGDGKTLVLRGDAEALRAFAQQLTDLAESAPSQTHLTFAADDEMTDSGAGEGEAFPVEHVVVSVESAAAETRTEAITTFLRGHLGEYGVLEALARELGVQKRDLAGVFRTAELPAPQKYLARLRVERAGELLLENRETIGQIAQALGYADVAAFSHFFRKHTGKSPREYREALEWLQ